MRRALLTLAFALVLAAPAGAEDVLGTPCTTQADTTRLCSGRVPTWDGIPLDVDLRLPPATETAPYPLVVFLHGFGGSKADVPASITALAGHGYAVLSYSARGFGNSCGGILGQTDSQCSKGWSHLADLRYEPRDTEYLAGLLADAGVAKPGIGVTGMSFGAGQALELAMLKDRIVLPDYSYQPWTSPKGTPMSIAAAAPDWGWSDLASVLVPNGRDLDYAVENEYDKQIGMPKVSLTTLLVTLGNATGHFPPPGTDFTADANTWYTQFMAGEPWTEYHAGVIDELEAHHSPYNVADGPAPAPIFANTAWADDLLPPTQMLVLRNRVLQRHPGSEFDLLFSGGAGYPRASLTGDTPDLANLQTAFFDRLLKGAAGKPLGVRTFTQACAGSAAAGPFDTETWAAQHPGEVRFDSTDTKTVASTSDVATATLVDPLAGATTSGCITTSASDDPAGATYRLPAAAGTGYTLLGSPIVRAQIAATSLQTQLDARLWDVAPDGSQAFITRVAYRPRLNDAGPQVFQLHPTGWQVQPGHVVKLELVGRDSPYVRAANEAFTVNVSGLQLRLPVRDTPGGQVKRPIPYQGRNGAPLTRKELAPEIQRACRRRVVLVTSLTRVHARTRAGKTLRVRRNRVIVVRGNRNKVNIIIRGVNRRGRHVVRRGIVRFCD